MAAIVQTTLAGTIQTLLSTELNSMASSTSTNVLGSAITLTSSGYLVGNLELVCGAASSMTANTVVLVWFLQNVDGTNYENGGTSSTPARRPDAIFPIEAVTSFRRLLTNIQVPVGTFKVLIQQQSGQTWNSSGNTLKFLPSTLQFN